MKIRFAVLPLLLIFILTGCSAQQSTIKHREQQATGFQKFSNTALDRSQFNNRKIAETHNLNFRTAAVDLKSRHQRDLDKCVSLHCNLLESSLDSQKNGSIRAAISPENLKMYLNFLKEGPGELRSHQVLAEDKTFEFIDVNARVTNLESLRVRLKSLLDNKDVDNIENILKIEIELRNVQEKLDSSKGKMNHLLSLTDNSIINIRYEVPYRNIDVPYQDLKNSFKSAWAAFIYSISSVIEFIGSVIPWIPVFFIGLWIIVKMFRIVFGKSLLSRISFWKSKV